MKEYLFTSSQFEGFVRFAYDDTGFLKKYINDSIMTNVQKAFFFHADVFPVHINMLEKLKTKTGKVEESYEVTFDRFWEEYDYKKGKLKATSEWNKLTEGEKAKAIYKIKAFKYYSHARNIELPYPERYLKHKRYDDE